MPFGVLFGNFLESFWILLGALGSPLGDFLVNFCSFGDSFWNVCWVVGFVGRFGEDLHGFWKVSDKIFNIS